jgi:hypothetical protein
MSCDNTIHDLFHSVDTAHHLAQIDVVLVGFQITFQADGIPVEPVDIQRRESQRRMILQPLQDDLLNVVRRQAKLP